MSQTSRERDVLQQLAVDVAGPNRLAVEVRDFLDERRDHASEYNGRLYVLHRHRHRGHLHELGQGGVPSGGRGTLWRGGSRHAQRVEGGQRRGGRGVRAVPVGSRRLRQDHTPVPYALGDD